MSDETHPHGFRIVGPCACARRRVQAATAFAAYCRCDVPRGVGSEAYLSAFQFGDDFAELLAATGSSAGFSGSTWSPYLWADVDRDEASGGVARAMADTVTLIRTLEQRHGVPGELLMPFLSGGKGMHLGIPTALWAPAASRDFHAAARRFMEAIAGQAGIAVDVGVFDRVRAFRAPNSRHPKTGLHKRYVPAAELPSVSADRLLSAAQVPKAFEPPCPVAGTRCAALAELWEDACGAINAAGAGQKGSGAGGDRRHPFGVNRITRAVLSGDVTVGERHRLLFSAAANLMEIGCSPGAVHALLTEPALDSGLPPKDVRRQITYGIAAARAQGKPGGETLPPEGMENSRSLA